MTESWKDVPGYNGKYQISASGKIRRVFPSGKTRELHPCLKKERDLIIHLTDALGRTKEHRFLSLVALTFLGPSPVNCVPYHVNGCKSEILSLGISFKLYGRKAKCRCQRNLRLCS